jgi:uncharacterized membrane protein (DUF106 family)
MLSLAFFIVSNPMVYKLTDKVLGPVVGPLSHGAGCPTTLGLLVHTVVFALVVSYLC